MFTLRAAARRRSDRSALSVRWTPGDSRAGLGKNLTYPRGIVFSESPVGSRDRCTNMCKVLRNTAGVGPWSIKMN
jgi:hypothetical protein